MRRDLETRSLEALRAYVSGDSSEPKVFSDLKDLPRDEVRIVLRLHRHELEAIDPIRSVILESII